MILAAIALCTVVSVHDADTFRCQDGQRIRVAVINAREVDGSCNHYPCPAMRHERALPIAENLLLGRTVRLHPVGRSGKRIVADVTLPDGRNYGCAMIASGAATDWSEYRARYRMGECGR